MNSIQTKAVSLGRAIDYLRLIESETRVTDESEKLKICFSEWRVIRKMEISVT